jgi:hypothetical protein
VAWGQWRAPDDRCWFPLLFAFIPPVANEKYTSYTAIEILFPFLIRIFFSRKYTVYFRRVERTGSKIADCQGSLKFN